MSADSHSFNVQLAKMVGLTEAILLQHFYFWHQRARNLPDMLRDGRVWFYRSVAEMREVFPYLSDANVRTAIQHLIDRGLVVKGDYSSASMYKATWYSLTIAAIQLFDLEEPQNPFFGTQNPFVESTKSICNSKQDNNKDNRKENRNIDNGRFVPPTIEQVRDYCESRGNNIDPQSFVDYYTANGWRVGRNPMKDWQAAVRQWEQRRKQETPNPRPFPRQQQESVYQRNARAFAEFQNRLNIQYADEQ